MKTVIGVLTFCLMIFAGAVWAADMAVVESGVGTSIEKRTIVGAATQFPADVGKVVAFTKVSGTGSSTLTHRWVYAGKTALEVKLSMGGSPWRVWSEKNIRKGQEGDWKVEVIDAGGKVVKTIDFKVGGGPKKP